MQASTNTAIELLAPAGSLESFFAAVDSGADAVFCGLSSFSARAKAKNFSLVELEQLKRYAAERGVKVYVALNTLLQEEELSQVVEVLLDLEGMAIDGIILQDMGLYHLARTWFPTIPLHASTQIQCHNLAAVLELEQLGFERVVLARELSLKEICHIHANSSIAIEHFVHGAMCYSISGHCLFSSYLDGRSGNRGRCIQPCRRRYHHNAQPGFYFSTSDFSAIEFIPQLIDAGVSSFKIEGRMKSAEYVAAVVAAYRMVIDAPASQQKECVAKARDILNMTMGRSTTYGFLQGTGNRQLVLSGKKGGLGKTIGRVQRVKKLRFSFTTADTLHVGDRIRIQPENDRQGSGFTIRSLQVNSRQTKRAAKGAFVTIPLSRAIAVSKGDLIYKLSTGKLFTASREACRRRLSKASPRTFPVDITFNCSQQRVILQGTAEDVAVHKVYDVEMFPADRTPLTASTLTKVFSKTANPFLHLAALNTSKLPPVIIKPSELNSIRRDFYKHLAIALTEKAKRKREQKISRIASASALKPPADIGTKPEEQLYVVTDQVSDVEAMNDYPGIQFVFPLREPLVTGARKPGVERRRVVWDLPSVGYDPDWHSTTGLIEDVTGDGFCRFRINNLSHFRLFSQQCDVKLYGGPWLYTLNSQAIEWQRTEGLLGYTFSLEDDKKNIARLLQANNGKGAMLIVYATVPLFTSRIPSGGDGKCLGLKNDQGELLSQRQEGDLVVTTGERPYSLLGRLQQLRQLGCLNFVVDLQGVGLRSAKGQEVIAAFYGDHLLSDTTLFNFERGLA